MTGRIGIEADLFQSRKQRIKEAGSTLQEIDLGGSAPSSGVAEFAGIDSALSQLRDAVRDVRDGVVSDLDDSAEALADTFNDMKKTDADIESAIKKLLGAMR